MHKGQVIMKKIILSAALLCLAAPAYAQEVDPMNPWQRDRDAHQQKMLEDAQRYKERFPVYVKERYVVDGVGVIDKEGARSEYNEKHAPVSLSCDNAEDEATDSENADSCEATSDVSLEDTNATE
tara:strand:- start:141376 stop:141750 length:375 start_codon:yes stop_codon:yes gene_type:complete